MFSRLWCVLLIVVGIMGCIVNERGMRIEARIKSCGVRYGVVSWGLCMGWRRFCCRLIYRIKEAPAVSKWGRRRGGLNEPGARTGHLRPERFYSLSRPTPEVDN